MKNTVFFIDWFIVSCHSVSCRYNTTLVNSNVNNDRTRTHLLYHFICHQFRSFGTRNQDSTDNNVCFTHTCFNIKWVRHQSLNLVTKDIFKYRETFSTDIKNSYLSSKTKSDTGCVCTNDTTTDDGYFSFWYTWDTTQENTRTTSLFR